MNARHSMGIGEWLRAAKENIGAIAFLLSIVVSGCGTVVAIAAWGVRWEVRKDTAFFREYVVWKLRRDGDEDDFLRYRAKSDSLDHATGRISSAGYPLFRSE